MKILIVDDNIDRLRRISSEIEKMSGVTIDTSSTQADALAYLTHSIYDLAIIDIALPLRLGGEPERNGGINLLRRITQSDRYHKPTQIIGLTAYEELMEKHFVEFDEMTWQIVYYNSSSEEWIKKILNTLNYKLRAESKTSIDYQTDVAIICVTEREKTAIERNGWKWSNHLKLDDNTSYQEAKFLNNGAQYSARLFKCERMGMIDSSIITSKIIHFSRPKVIVMIGICAGLKGDTELGDVIFADQAWDWQSGKYQIFDGKEKFEINPDYISADRIASSKFDILSSDSTLPIRMRENWPQQSIRTIPKLIRGPIASGSAVIADQKRVNSIQEQNRKLVGIEMEIYGVYRAAFLSSKPSPAFYAMKAVCDYADSDKIDGYQDYSANNVSFVLKEMLEKYYSDICG